MRFPRSSGILLHISSLPGPVGCGDLGPASRTFVDLLARTGQSFWQVLPLGPTGYGHSPYQSLSSFAGNSLLISPEHLAADGWLDSTALDGLSHDQAQRVDFAALERMRNRTLTEACRRFYASADRAQRGEFQAFCSRQSWWLNDYALFVALKEAHGGRAWTTWDEAFVRRDPQALARQAAILQPRIELENFAQFQFWSQWQSLKRYANARGVRFVGDVPIFVAHDSADVWTNQDLFKLDRQGNPTGVAGVPPDYFSQVGQLWGNPLYRWDAIAGEQYAWWVRRFRRALEWFDVVRVDHFRGFEAYWEIPAGAKDARQGQWVPGPGAALFEAVERQLGPLPVIAEDLGVITPPVDALRQRLGFPGMRVLQFAFGDDPKGPAYRPHNYPRHCIVYTGTHDNDTTAGWFHSQAGRGTTRSAEQIERERAFALAYLGTDGREIHWDLIRLAFASVADVAIVPMQDVLGLGSEARMNLPGTASGNWAWRMAADAWSPAVERRLAELTSIYDRAHRAAAGDATRGEDSETDLADSES